MTKLSKRMQRALARLEKVPGGLVMAEDMLDEFADEAETAGKAFKSFHWGDDPDALVPTVAAARTRAGDVVVSIGELVSVVYETEKAGQLYDWEHEFEGERPELAHITDRSGNSKSPSLVIVGGTYKVNSRGIVG